MSAQRAILLRLISIFLLPSISLNPRILSKLIILLDYKIVIDVQICLITNFLTYSANFRFIYLKKA